MLIWKALSSDIPAFYGLIHLMDVCRIEESILASFEICWAAFELIAVCVREIERECVWWQLFSKRRCLSARQIKSVRTIQSI